MQPPPFSLALDQSESMIALAAIIFISTPNSNAAALTIRLSELPQSIGFVQIEQFPEAGTATSLKVLSKQFEEFRIAPTAEVHQQWVDGLGPSTGTAEDSKFVFFEQLEEEQPGQRSGLTLDDPKSGRYFTFWKDRGFETSTHPIIVWKKTKESLVFETILDRAFLVGIGLPTLDGIVHLGKGRHLLVGETCGGDGGDIWGSVWIALWSEPRQLQILKEIPDDSCMSTPQKLDYKFDRRSRKISLKRLTKAEAIPDVNGVYHESPWHLGKEWSVNLDAELK